MLACQLELHLVLTKLSVAVVSGDLLTFHVRYDNIRSLRIKIVVVILIGLHVRQVELLLRHRFSHLYLFLNA